MNRNEITVKDLIPNAIILREAEMDDVRRAVFDAVAGLIGKGYNRSEVMEAIYSACHATSLESILKLRVRINKGISPWGNNED